MPTRGELPTTLQIPDQPRHAKLYPFQRVGLPLMLLVPALALFGVFGETEGRADDANAELALTVEHPERSRYLQDATLRVFVENVSNLLLDTVVVAFDPEYVLQFSNPTFIPSPEKSFLIELLDVQPGEMRIVWAGLKAERYGRHRGTVDVYGSRATDTVSVSFETFVFP